MSSPDTATSFIDTVYRLFGAKRKIDDFPIYPYRPLSPIDSVWFEHFPVAIVLNAFQNIVRRPPEEKINAAFQRTILHSPLMQTTIVGDGDKAVFRQLPSSVDWPKVIYIHAEDDDEKMKAGLRLFAEEQGEAFLRSKEAPRR